MYLQLSLNISTRECSYATSWIWVFTEPKADANFVTLLRKIKHKIRYKNEDLLRMSIEITQMTNFLKDDKYHKYLLSIYTLAFILAFNLHTYSRVMSFLS